MTNEGSPFDSDLSVISDFILLDLSPKQQKDFVATISGLDMSRADEFASFANGLWKRSKRHQEALRFVRLLTLIKGYDKSKVIGDAFQALDAIDASGHVHQFLAAARYISKFAKISDLPAKPTLGVFAVAKFLNITDTALLEKLADAFGECVTKVTKVTVPSFRFARMWASSIPRDIFIAKVVPRFERQLLRASEAFLRICVVVLPDFDLPVGDRSIGLTLLNTIANKGSATDAPKWLVKYAHCFDTNELLQAAIRVYKGCSAADKKVVLASALGKLSTKKASDETVAALIELIEGEKNMDYQAKLIGVLCDKADKAIDLVSRMKLTQENLGAVCDVLVHAEDARAVELVRASFATAPGPVGRLLLRKGVELSGEELSQLSGPSKYPAEKIEALLLSKQLEECKQFFASGAASYVDAVVALQDEVIAEFLKCLVEDSAIPDSILLKFKPKVTANPKAYDRLVVAILTPENAVKDDVAHLIQMLGVRCALATKALVTIGFTSEQMDYVREKFDAYFEDPLPDIDVQLLLTGLDSTAIFEEHPSAEKYLEMKNEIARPNAKTNLPSLKKQFEKLGPKVEEKQKQLKQELFANKVAPIKDSLSLLLSHLKAPWRRVSSGLTSLTSYLLKFRQIPLFEELSDACLLSAINRIAAYRDIPTTVFHIVVQNPDDLNNDLLGYLVPNGHLTDFMLHVIANHLPALLATKDGSKFCDVSGITEDADRKLLLPIYVEASSVCPAAIEFAIGLASKIPVSKMMFLFDYLLDRNPVVRELALNCIHVSNFDIEVSPKFVCVLHIHSITDELGTKMLEEFKNPELSADVIIGEFEKLFNLNSQDKTLQKSIGHAFAKMMANQKDAAVKFLVGLYNQNIEKVEAYKIPDQNNVRYALSFAFADLKPTSLDSIDFITLTGLKDSVPEVRQNMVTVCEFYISMFDKRDIPDLFKRFFDPLNLPPIASPDNNRLRACLIQLCQKITEADPSLTDSLINCIVSFNIRSPDDDLRQVCAKTLSKLAKKQPNAIQGRIDDLMKTRSTLNTVERIMGFAYAYAAYCHAQGFSVLKKGVFDYTDQLYQSKDPVDRALACFVYGGLSLMFGSMLEPSLPRVLDALLQLFGDRDKTVREAAARAIDAIVNNLTHACVDRVMPYALKNVENDSSWRIQHASVLLVIAVLKANPKNISKVIPNVVGAMATAMKSATSDVREAATEAMNMIKGNITNEAVSEIFPYLIQAITSPAKLPIAIEKITHLNLTQKLDMSSLSLIVPVVAVGAESSEQSIKMQSLRVVSHLPEISITQALSAFTGTLVQPLLNAVADGSPNVRAIAAASLSALVSCFDEAAYDDIMKTLLTEMTTKGSFSERQGSAQAVASLIKARGTETLDLKLREFVNYARNAEEINVREGYVALLGFLSHFFGIEFLPYYDLTIEAVLDACADSNDTIRTVGLRSASLVAKTFSLTHPKLILEPYFACSLKQDWRQRLCAVNFMKSFVMAVTGTTEADDKGIRVIGELLENLEKAVTKEVLYPALFTLFVLSADPVPNVSQEALLVWRQVVPNTGQFLSHSMDLLLERIETFTSSPYEVVRTVGAAAMALGVNKLRTRFLLKCLERIERNVESDNIDVVHGAVVSVDLLAEFMDQDQKLKACTIIAPHLSSPFPETRRAAIDAFVKMRESLGDVGARQVSIELVKYVFAKAQSGEDVGQLSGLLGILGYHAMVDLTSRILQKPLTEDRPEIAVRLIGVAGAALNDVMAGFSERLISMSAHPLSKSDGEIAIKIAWSVIDVVSDEHRLIFTTKLVDNMRNQQPENRKAAITIAGHMLKCVSTHFTDITKSLVRSSLYMLDDPLESIQEMAISALQTVAQSLGQSEIPLLIKELADTMESQCTVSQVRAFERPEAFETLNLMIEAAFDTGIENAVVSAASVLATVVPQLKDTPTATRKLLARCVLGFQMFDNTDTLMKILQASRALFEKAASERQMLINSLPMAYIRLFRSGTLGIQTAAADAMVAMASRLSQPMRIVRCLLQIVRAQGLNVSSTVVNAIISTVSSMRLSDAESCDCVSAIQILLEHPRVGMRELASQAISVVLLSSSQERMKQAMEDTSLIGSESPNAIHTTVIIINELLKSKSQATIEFVLPRAIALIDKFKSVDVELVANLVPTVIVTMMLCDYELITKLMPSLQKIMANGSLEQQVICCQELCRLKYVRSPLWDKEKLGVLNALMTCYEAGDLALQSGAASSMFDLFSLDEQSPAGLEKLAGLLPTPRSALKAFTEIIQQVQADRQNQRVRR